MKNSIVKFFAFVLCVVCSASVCAAQKTAAAKNNSGGYHLIKRIEVGGDGFWDYVYDDAQAHRLYVSHSTKVVVIDTDTYATVGEITNTNGVHGIAVAGELGRGFTSNGRDDSVTVFDLKTLKSIDTIKVGKNPDAILYDAATNRVFAFNGGSSDATVIEAATGKVAGTIALGGKPEFAQSDLKGTIFVNIEDTSEIAAIDARALTVKSRWSIAPGEEASGLAIDRKTHRLFAVCSNAKMIVVNYDTGKVVDDLPIGEGTDAAAFDAKTKLAFASNGAGTLTVVREDSSDKFTVAENISTMRGARTMALDEKTHRVFLPTAQLGETPAASAERPHPRPSIVPNSFVILVYGK